MIETDGRQSHSDLIARQEDPRRDQDLTALGWTVIRVPYRQMQREPARVARLVCGLIEAGPRVPSGGRREL